MLVVRLTRWMLIAKDVLNFQASCRASEDEWAYHCRSQCSDVLVREPPGELRAPSIQFAITPDDDSHNEHH
jgi:hypothetical protein